MRDPDGDIARLAARAGAKVLGVKLRVLDKVDRFRAGACAPGSYEFAVVPMGKPRMTQRDRWKTPPRPAVAAYRAFADRLRDEANAQQFAPPEANMAITFYLPMPASWGRRRRAQCDGQPHRSRPDLDNLLKGFMDVLLCEDSGIWHIGFVEKRWATMGSIVVTIGGDQPR